MLRVGITGGIGSGKSTVCQIISAMGYPVYNADIEARKLTNSHPSIINGLTSLFGSDIYVNGELNRKRVGQLVFADKTLLQQLNSVIHPVVAAHFENWVKANQNHRLVFKEAAILFESGAYKQVDKTVVVFAPDELRIKRVCLRDGIFEDEVQSRMANQMPQKHLVSKADYVINNTEQQLLVPQVIELVGVLLN